MCPSKSKLLDGEYNHLWPIAISKWRHLFCFCLFVFFFPSVVYLRGLYMICVVLGAYTNNVKFAGSRNSVNLKSDDYSKSRHVMVLKKSQGHKGSSGGAPNIVHRPPESRNLGPPTLISTTLVCFSFILLLLLIAAWLNVPCPSLNTFVLFRTSNHPFLRMINQVVFCSIIWLN